MTANTAQDERTQFDYLLNAFEHASQADKPAEHDYGAKRRALFAYVRDLERRARLSAPVAAPIPSALAIQPWPPGASMLQVAVAPNAAAGPYPTAMRPATAEEVAAMQQRFAAPVAAQPAADSTEQALGLYVAQADEIRDLLDAYAPFTRGNLQTRVAQVCLSIDPPAQPAALADIPDAELPGMWERADFMGGQDEALPAASGVDDELLLALAKSKGATTYTNRHFPGEPAVAFGNESWKSFCEALRAHLSTALTGAAKDTK